MRVKCSSMPLAVSGAFPSSDPVMWRDICLANGDAIQLMIGHFVADLQALTTAIENRDGQYLLNIFTSARDARDRYVDK